LRECGCEGYTNTQYIKEFCGGDPNTVVVQISFRTHALSLFADPKQSGGSSPSYGAPSAAPQGDFQKLLDDIHEIIHKNNENIAKEAAHSAVGKVDTNELIEMAWKKQKSIQPSTEAMKCFIQEATQTALKISKRTTIIQTRERQTLVKRQTHQKRVSWKNKLTEQPKHCMQGVKG